MVSFRPPLLLFEMNWKNANQDSQEIFIDLAQKRMDAAAKHRQAKLRKKLLNHFHKRLRTNKQ